jgi:hypothetical protein
VLLGGGDEDQIEDGQGRAGQDILLYAQTRSSPASRSCSASTGVKHETKAEDGKRAKVIIVSLFLGGLKEILFSLEEAASGF